MNAGLFRTSPTGTFRRQGLNTASCDALGVFSARWPFRRHSVTNRRESGFHRTGLNLRAVLFEESDRFRQPLAAEGFDILVGGLGRVMKIAPVFVRGGKDTQRLF